MWGFTRRREAATAAVQPAHDAVLGNTVIHFARTVPTAKAIDLGKATKSLLDNELALSASWPTDDSARLPPSLANAERRLARLRSNQEWSEAVTDKRSRIRETVRHPITAFHVFGETRTAAPHSHNTEENQPIDSLFEQAETSLVRIQAVTVVERRMDANLFWSETEDRDAYVRFLLHPTVHTIRVGSQELKITMQPRVLLHRDGVLQVTLRVALPSDCTPQQIITASFPDEPLFTHSRFPDVYSPDDDKWKGGEWETDAATGDRERVFDDVDEPAAVNDWFRVVTSRILATIGARQNGPMYTYPMILTQAGGCCDRWADEHNADLVHLTVRTVPRPGQKIMLDTGPDLSIHSGIRIHATAGSMVRVHFGAWESGLRDFETTLLFERIGLVYVRLRALERRITDFETAGRDIQRTYRAALQLEKEVRGAFHRAGTARETTSHVLTQLGVPEILTGIREGVGMLGERASTRASLRAARAANRFALIGVVVAIIAAVPAIPMILALVEQQRAADPDGGVWAVLQTLLTSPVLLSALILGVAAVYGVGFVARVGFRVVRYLLSLRKRGYMSQVRGYDITLHERENEPSWKTSVVNPSQ